MTFDQKLMICRLRLEGRSIHEIGKEIRFSAQTVLNFLNKLPRNDKVKAKRPHLDAEIMLGVCEDYLKGLSVYEISLKTGISEKIINDIFWYITARKPSHITSEIYPAVAEWMQINGHTLKSMSQLLGLPTSSFSQILSGKKHMPLAVAYKIRGISGLPLATIFEKHLREQPSGEARAQYVKPPVKRQVESDLHG
jgi:DNA-binding Lrp family transcriptional regulator